MNYIKIIVRGLSICLGERERERERERGEEVLVVWLRGPGEKMNEVCGIR